jgi:prophage antirepressor-like protein
MEIIETFSKDSKQIDVYGTFQEPLFLGKDIGKMLDMPNIRKVIGRIHANWKIVTKVYPKKKGGKGSNQPMTFLKEPGLYYILMRSNKKESKPFQRWICEEVIPSLRKTGSYKLDQHAPFKQLTFKIETEYDLHTKVVNFLKNRFPDSLFTASLGENQDTGAKRLKSFKMGYLKGTPDLIINNLHKDYNGFAIEFKSPKGTGTVTEEQSKMLKKYERNQFKTLVTNDYDECVLEIVEYFKEVRIQCEYCTCKFKTSESLASHHKHFHRIGYNEKEDLEKLRLLLSSKGCSGCDACEDTSSDSDTELSEYQTSDDDDSLLSIDEYNDLADNHSF